jgi:hypothetical protein
MEGLWSIAFSTPLGANYGVAFFTAESNFVGGDSVFYWTGTISSQAGRLVAKLTGRSHSGRPMPTILGTSAAEFSLELGGEFPASLGIGTTFKITGPSGFVATLTRRN